MLFGPLTKLKLFGQFGQTQLNFDNCSWYTRRVQFLPYPVVLFVDNLMIGVKYRVPWS